MLGRTNERESGVKTRWRIAMALFASGVLILVGACKPQPPPGAEASPVAESTAAESATENKEKGGRTMTVLGEILSLFVSARGEDWKAYDAIAGIQWFDGALVENEDVTDPSVRHSRSGRVTLAGFGEVDLPDGNTGVDAGTRRGNEGESGLTLNGDAERVNEIAIVKHFPSEDYKAILEKQFPQARTVLVADDCQLDFATQEANTQGNKFYRVEFSGAEPAHAEVYVDEGGKSGPGSTTLVFYRSKPEQRIATMKCREV
jgi:hypothetical protein